MKKELCFYIITECIPCVLMKILIWCWKLKSHYTIHTKHHELTSHTIIFETFWQIWKRAKNILCKTLQIWFASGQNTWIRKFFDYFLTSNSLESLFGKIYFRFLSWHVLTYLGWVNVKSVEGNIYKPLTKEAIPSNVLLLHFSSLFDSTPGMII